MTEQTAEGAGQEFEDFLLSDNAEDDAPDNQEEEELEASEDAEDATEADEDEVEADEEVEEGDSEDEEPDEQLFTIWDDDGPRQVSEAEAKSATMRMRDYTQKTMEAAERRKEAEAALEARNADREALKEQLAQWAVNQPQEPDWHELARTMQPQEFNLARVQWEQHLRQNEAAREQYRAIVAEQEADAQAERDRQKQESLEQLKQLYPDWRNPKVASKEVGEIVEFGKTLGFTDIELQGLSDHRMVRALREAMMYQRVSQNTAQIEKRVSDPGKTLRPGGKTTAKQIKARSTQKALKRLRETGSSEAFADWLTS